MRVTSRVGMQKSGGPRISPIQLPLAAGLIESFRILLVLLFLTTLNACSTLAPSRSPDTDSSLTTEVKQQALDSAWTRVKDRYYDSQLRGLNWLDLKSRYADAVQSTRDDVSFWARLDYMVGELRDSHTHVLNPYQYSLYKNEEALSIGLRLEFIEDAWIVTHVTKDSDAEKAGIQVGAKVISVGDMDTNAFWQKEIQRSREMSTEHAKKSAAFRRGIMNAVENTQVKLGFENPDSTTLLVDLTRKKIKRSPTLVTKVLPGNILQIRVSEFDRKLMTEFSQTMKKAGAYQGIILDLRNNPGGALGFSRIMIESFVAEEKLVMQQQYNNSVSATKLISSLLKIPMVFQTEYKTKSNPDAYTGPLAILINQGSASASELTSIALQESRGAKVFGDISCGCLLAVMEYYVLPGGGALRVSEIGFKTPKNYIVEGNGVIPDQIIKPTRADIINKRDPQLEAALRWVGEQLKDGK